MVNVERKGQSKAWRLQLVGIPAIASVQGASAEHSPQGVLVTCSADTDVLQILLP